MFRFIFRYEEETNCKEPREDALEHVGSVSCPTTCDMREAASRGCTNHENVAMIAIHSVTSPENFVLLTSYIITTSRKAGRFCDSSNTAPCGTAHDEHTSKAKAITGGKLVRDFVD